MNRIRFSILATSMLVVSTVAFAQEKNEPLNWHHLSFATDSVYGAEINRAYDFLKDKKSKRKVIVAIIDGGVDVEHEDIKANLWVNKREIAGNGIDDDQNGYVDDIHGWNFLGNSRGEQDNGHSLEADRLFMRLHEKYLVTDTTKLSKEDFAEYRYYRDELPLISPLGNAFKAISVSYMIAGYADVFDAELKEKFPNEVHGKEHFRQLMNREEKNMDRVNAHFFFAMGWSGNKEAKWAEMYGYKEQIIEAAKTQYAERLAMIKDERKICGDNLADINSRNYGNNILLANKSDHGMHVAGIVGATRNNDLGIDGIADVELMILRVCAGKGDEYDKDVALAIEYAVANGANIINMSFGKPITSNKKWVDDAMLKAEKKGVLLIHAAGNTSEMVDEKYYHPSKHVSKTKDLTNFITVGSISSDGKPATSSNYGKKEVDLFAPGINIYSAIVGDNYKKMNGTSMAAPVVTGVAAMIWNYFPELTAQQVKEAILSGVTTRRGVVVAKPQNAQLITAPVPVDFSELCVTGGILNAYNAVKIASTITKKQ